MPGNLLGLHLRRRLALADGRPGHANIRFMTIVDFARELCAAWLLEKGYQQPPPLVEQLLLSQAVSSVIPEDGYFAAARGQDAFCHSLYATITDLKEACIHPEELSRWANGLPDPREGGHKFKELAQIFADYKSRLGRMAFLDRSNILDRAAERDLRLEDFSLFIYGFYDLNPLQRKFLQMLLREKETLIFFPWREGGAFDYALPSLTWLKSLGCEHIPLKPLPAAPLQSLTHALFEAPDRSQIEEEPQGSVSIISAPGERREVLEIARECLRWVEGHDLSFSDIGILLRHPEPYSSLFAESFSHIGIPYYLHEGNPLWKNRVGQSLRLLLKILAENFSRTSVMEFITYAPIAYEHFLGKSAGHANPALWDLFSLEAGIVEGRAPWQERLQRLHRRMEWEEKERERREENDMETPPPLAHLEAFTQFLDPFFDALQTFPRHGPWSKLAQSLSALLRRLLSSSPETQRVTDVIEGMGRFDCLNEEIALERFAKAAEALLTSAKEPTGGFGKGGIFIGDLMSARGLPFKAVVVPGMVEKFFPRPWRQDPILLDHERQYISEQLKKELAQKNRGYDEERLLFTLTLMAAKERILFTFPRLEPLTGRERIPSFFLLRLMEAATGRAVNFSDLEGWSVMRRVSLSRLSPGAASEALDLLEYDLCQADEALQSKDMASLSYLSSQSPFFSRSLRAEAKRWGSKLFTEFDGRL